MGPFLSMRLFIRVFDFPDLGTDFLSQSLGGLHTNPYSGSCSLVVLLIKLVKIYFQGIR